MKKDFSSRISQFYQLKIEDRQRKIQELCNLSESELGYLQNYGYLDRSQLNLLSENVIGSYQLPFSIATNFRINGKDYLIPMVTEESSVVAAASFGAKFARNHDGFLSSPVKAIMTGQIQIVPNNQSEIDEICQYIQNNHNLLLEIANKEDPLLVSLGGGAKEISYKRLDTILGQMIIIHLDVDVKDAMGANAVNTMVESIAEFLRDKIPSKILLRIISNLPIKRIVQCKAKFDSKLLGGKSIIKNILLANAFAQADPFRAATHNKGIMNGIIAFSLATGNDTRAIEAGAHAYASFQSDKGQYSPLTNYYLDSDGVLNGEIKIPLALGTVGGLTQKHPLVKTAFKILGINNSEELTQVAAAVGLAQNIAALRALSDEGIQKGHMQLHKRKMQFK